MLSIESILKIQDNKNKYLIFITGEKYGFLD
jgi:hypothetical protein